MECEHFDGCVCINMESEYYGQDCNIDCGCNPNNNIIFKQKGIASEIVLDIVEVNESTKEDEYVYVERGFWGYPYNEHLYITVVNNDTQKETRIIEYYDVNRKEAYGVIHILADLGNEYTKISKHYGEKFDYKNDYWTVEEEELINNYGEIYKEYIVHHKKHLIPRYYFKNENEANIVCEFMNREEIIKFR